MKKTYFQCNMVLYHIKKVWNKIQQENWQWQDIKWSKYKIRVTEYYWNIKPCIKRSKHSQINVVYFTDDYTKLSETLTIKPSPILKKKLRKNPVFTIKAQLDAKVRFGAKYVRTMTKNNDTNETTGKITIITSRNFLGTW